MKKTLLTLGAIAALATPIVAVVSCGSKKGTPAEVYGYEEEKPTLKPQHSPENGQQGEQAPIKDDVADFYNEGYGDGDSVNNPLTLNYNADGTQHTVLVHAQNTHQLKDKATIANNGTVVINKDFGGTPQMIGDDYKIDITNEDDIAKFTKATKFAMVIRQNEYDKTDSLFLSNDDAAGKITIEALDGDDHKIGDEDLFAGSMPAEVHMGNSKLVELSLPGLENMPEGVKKLRVRMPFKASGALNVSVEAYINHPWCFSNEKWDDDGNKIPFIEDELGIRHIAMAANNSSDVIKNELVKLSGAATYYERVVQPGADSIVSLGTLKKDRETGIEIPYQGSGFAGAKWKVKMGSAIKGNALKNLKAFGINMKAAGRDDAGHEVYFKLGMKLLSFKILDSHNQPVFATKDLSAGDASDDFATRLQSDCTSIMQFAENTFATVKDDESYSVEMIVTGDDAYDKDFSINDQKIYMNLFADTEYTSVAQEAPVSMRIPMGNHNPDGSADSSLSTYGVSFISGANYGTESTPWLAKNYASTPNNGADAKGISNNQPTMFSSVGTWDCGSNPMLLIWW